MSLGRTQRRILLNASALSITEGIGQIANFIFVFLFARHFGAVEMGHYSVAMATGAITALLVSLGTPGLLVREFSRDASRAAAWLGTLLPVQIPLAALAWVIATGITVALVRSPAALPLALAICAYQILLRMAVVLATPLVATERMVRLSATDAAHRLLTLGLGLWAMRQGASANLVVWSFVLGSGIYLGFVWRQTATHAGRPHLRFAPRRALRIIKRSTPFFGVSAFSIIYGRLAVIMVSALETAHAVGVYAAADRLMVAAGLAPTMFNSAAYPALTRVAAESRAAARTLCGRSLLLMLLGTLPLAALFAALARPILLLLFGPAYGEAAWPLQILAWTLPIRGTQSLLGSQLSAFDQQHALARARFGALWLFAALSSLLIWRAGIGGAAFAVLFSDAALLLYYVVVLRAVEAMPSFEFLRSGAQSS